MLNVIKKTAEPKFIHVDIQNIRGPSTLKHNSYNEWVIYSVNSPYDLFPTVGDGVNQRNGNEIYAKGFMFRGSFNFAGDRRGTTLRFYLISPSNTTEGNTYNNVFQNITDNVRLFSLKWPNCLERLFLNLNSFHIRFR